MVHALAEVHRVLSPNGLLIDLRPLAGGAAVEIASARETQVAARIEQTADDREHDEAADAAIAEANAVGWFAKERESHFSFCYYFDSPSELEQWVDEDWADAVTLAEGARSRIRGDWAVADGDARLRVPLMMLIARWRRLNK